MKHWPESGSPDLIPQVEITRTLNAYLCLSLKLVPSDRTICGVNLLCRMLTNAEPIFAADLARLVRV